MIEILTFFLGMVSGPQTVELSVADEVAWVEVWLDGEVVARLQEPPWTLDVDLGPALLPHELLAVAHDDGGQEMARSRRWINVETPVADARLELVAQPGKPPTAVILHWEGVARRQLEGFEVTLDGAPLVAGRTSDGILGATLPVVDLGLPHVLEATVRLGGGQEQSLTAAFGGRLGLTLDSELTAVIPTLEPGAGSLPKVDELVDWFRADGMALEVHGVEQGQGDVLLVRSPSVQAWIDTQADQAVAWGRNLRGRPVVRGRAHFDSARFFSDPKAAFEDRAGPGGAQVALSLLALRGATSLGSDDHLRIVSTDAAPLVAGAVAPEMFATSPEIEGAAGGLLRLATRDLATDFPDQTADAVALAGMLAHAGHGRRVVVLMLEGPEPADDASLYSPGQVRDYLRSLGVPLRVWSLTGPTTSFEHPEWGRVEVLDGPKGPLRTLEKATGELRQELARQRVVWLVGTHLPGTVELGPTARGVRWPE